MRGELGEPEGLRLVEADLSKRRGSGGGRRAAADGALAGLVTLAGGFASGGRLHEAPQDEFGRMLELNLMTAARLSRAALPRADRGRRARSSASAPRRRWSRGRGRPATSSPRRPCCPWCGPWRSSTATDGVRANAILPSVIDTPANRESMPDADHSAWVAPAEIAAVIRFLLSADSAPVSGSLVPVYGRAGGLDAAQPPGLLRGHLAGRRRTRSGSGSGSSRRTGSTTSCGRGCG